MKALPIGFTVFCSLVFLASCSKEPTGPTPEQLVKNFKDGVVAYGEAVSNCIEKEKRLSDKAWDEVDRLHANATQAKHLAEVRENETGRRVLTPTQIEAFEKLEAMEERAKELIGRRGP